MNSRDPRTNSPHYKPDSRRTANYDKRNDRSRRTGRRSSNRSFARLKDGSNVFVLDVLQHGGVDKAGHSWQPISQVIEVPNFNFYELCIDKKEVPNIKLEEKYIFSEMGDSKFTKVNHWLKISDLTPTALSTLDAVIKLYVKENEERFVRFLNNVGPITIKRHYLEVLPGVGKKLMQEILSQRHHAPFTDYADICNRIPGFKSIEIISKRILEELEDDEIKHYLFVRKRKPRERAGSSQSSGRSRNTSFRASSRKRY